MSREKRHIGRINTVNFDEIDLGSIYIEVNSLAWRTPHKMSLRELTKFKGGQKHDISKDIDNKTIVIDPKTLKVKVNESLLDTSNVFYDTLNGDKVSIYKAPKDDLDGSELHLRSDENYLYVWTKNRWKKIPLSEW
jgi:hypothetical protein